MPPKSSRGTAPHQPSSIPIIRQYLVLYNSISCLLWTSLALRGLVSLPGSSLSTVYPTVGTFARNVQTLAVAEIIHSLIGIVRAPIATTGLQVASRLLLVWGIVEQFGSGLQLGSRYGDWKNQAAYTGMLTAWSVTEVVRYAYFTVFLGSGNNMAKVPSWLSWARYNGFFVLYPLGISCECWLVYKSLPMADTLAEWYGWALRAALAIYVPGSYVLFTHMMAQRRRIMRGKQRAPN